MSDASLDATTRLLIRMVELVSGRRSLQAKYEECRASTSGEASFWNEAVRILGIRLEIDPQSTGRSRCGRSRRRRARR